MFDVAPSELLIVAIVALVVIGPKDLPKAMRYVGQWVGKAKAMARHFRSGIDTMIQDAELEEMEQKWRAHNEAIMQAHPHLNAEAPAPGAEERAPVMTPMAPAPNDPAPPAASDGSAAMVPPHFPPQAPS
jgi:sec-independent protein translocase protein TatB